MVTVLIWVAVAIFALIIVSQLYEAIKDSAKGKLTWLNSWLPDEWFYADNDPPWKSPRTVTDSPIRRDVAEFRLLKKRLTFVAHETRRLGTSGIAHLDLYLDEETGQHWFETAHERFIEWQQLTPASGPGDDPPGMIYIRTE